MGWFREGHLRLFEEIRVLTLLKCVVITIFVTLVVAGQVSTLLTLVVMPVIFTLVKNFCAKVKSVVLRKVGRITPANIVLIFTVLCFNVVVSTNLFRPVIGAVLQVMGKSPLGVTLKAITLTSLITLSKSKAAAFVVAIATVLPLCGGLGVGLCVLSALTLLSVNIVGVAP